jgi:hypothetical protein
MRRGVVAFVYSSAQKVTFSLNGTSRFSLELGLHVTYHMEIGAIAYQRIGSIGIGLSMANAEFDLQVHSHLHLESLTRTILSIAPPSYTLS